MPKKIAESTGWIKLYRKLRKNSIYNNSKAVHCWIECLLRANHTEQTFYSKREEVTLKPGQFLMGYEEFANSIGIAKATIHFWINKFKEKNMVELRSNGKGTIVTIKNWEDYQNVELRLNSDRKQIDPNKNVKNDKNDKNKLSEDIDKIIDCWQQHGVINHGDPVLTKARKDINRRLKDGFTVEQICQAIRTLEQAYNRDDCWWSRKWSLSMLMKRKSGEWIERFAKGLEKGDFLKGNTNTESKNSIDWM